MMIVMWEHSLNEHVANHLSNPRYHGLDIEYYPNLNLSSAYARKNDTLFLIDLRANGEFQDLLAPYLLARDIIKGKAQEGIKQIELLISDVNMNKPLADYAHKLANSFKHEYHRDIAVYAPHDKNYAMIILVPPTLSATHEWHVYGINQAEAAKLSGPCNLKTLMACPVKKHLWKGSNLSEWLHQQPAFSADTYPHPTTKHAASLR